MTQGQKNPLLSTSLRGTLLVKKRRCKPNKGSERKRQINRIKSSYCILMVPPPNPHKACVKYAVRAGNLLSECVLEAGLASLRLLRTLLTRSEKQVGGSYQSEYCQCSPPKRLMLSIFRKENQTSGKQSEHL